MSDDFTGSDGWTLDDGDRPGEVLHPGQNTIVNRGNNPLQQGETIVVWAKHYSDMHGSEVCYREMEVIGDDGEGDIFAIPDDESAFEASRVYRLSGDLRTLRIGQVFGVPSYDSDEGVLQVTREVKMLGGRDHRIIEARTLGGSQDWALGTRGEL